MRRAARGDQDVFTVIAELHVGELPYRGQREGTERHPVASLERKQFDFLPRCAYGKDQPVGV